MNLLDKFYLKLVMEELENSSDQAVMLATPVTIISKPLEFLESKSIIEKADLKIPDFLMEVYKQTQMININWVLSKNDKNTLDTFKKDPWLIENYYDEAQSWDYLNEIFTGNLSVPPLERLLGGSENSEDGYYVVTDFMGLDPNSFCPLDYHNNRYTAVLRIEKQSVKDEVWLLDMDARELHNMKISIEEYLNLAYQAKLFDGWPSVYLNGKKSESFELMKRYLPKLIPHINLDLEPFGIK